MTRLDSNSGKLFDSVPTDFVCLNHDTDGDGMPDNLEDFDQSLFSAGTTCPFDPTSPPVLSHQITGAIEISSPVELDLSNFEVLTTDGPGNCEVAPEYEYPGYYRLAYKCTVFDWGRGWTGGVLVRPNSKWLFCPDPGAAFANLTTDSTQSFSCNAGPTITVEGPITYLVSNTEISSIAIEEAGTGYRGKCQFLATKYRCVAPYSGSVWNGALTVTAAKHVCGSVNNVFDLANLTVDGSPYFLNVTVVQNSRNCPLEVKVQ
jgi:hypothetical protein